MPLLSASLDRTPQCWSGRKRLFQKMYLFLNPASCKSKVPTSLDWPGVDRCLGRDVHLLLDGILAWINALRTIFKDSEGLFKSRCVLAFLLTRYLAGPGKALRLDSSQDPFSPDNLYNQTKWITNIVKGGKEKEIWKGKRLDVLNYIKSFRCRYIT